MSHDPRHDPRRDPLWDGSPDPELDALAGLLSELRSEAELPELPERRPPRRSWAWPVALAAGLLLAAGVWWARQPEAPAPPELVEVPPEAPEDGAFASAPGAAGPWTLETLDGPELCAHAPCALTPGQWLETRADQRALLAVADIGWMELSPRTRLRLVETGPEQHRLELAWGQVEAFVVAPPRLLVVDTPSARAVDLGCAYTLAVDPQGAGSLQVRSGWVALETAGPEVIVAAGLRAPIRAGGPGLPRRERAAPAFERALDRWDIDRDAEALDALLIEASADDALSLWHVLRRAPPEQRGPVLDQLEAWLGPVSDREGALALAEAPLRELLVRSTERWGAPPP